MNLNEVNKPEVKKTVVIYAGRFQPFHKGHFDAYSRLCSKFGSSNVYIGTSNDTSGEKSPFNFNEKKKIATEMFGIPSSHFIKVNNPYRPFEILKKFDGKTTQYIAAVGDKDADRLQGKYFKPYNGKAGYGYDEIGYVYPVPPEKNPISGTDVRKGLGSSDNEKAKKFFLKAYPKYNRDIFTMIKKKLAEGIEMFEEDGMPGGIGTGLVLPGGYINGAPTGSQDENYNSIQQLVRDTISEAEINSFLNDYFNYLFEDSGTDGIDNPQNYVNSVNKDWKEFDEYDYVGQLPGWHVEGHLSDSYPDSATKVNVPVNNHNEENGPGKRVIHPSKGTEYAEHKRQKWEVSPHLRIDKTYKPDAPYEEFYENTNSNKPVIGEDPNAALDTDITYTNSKGQKKKITARNALRLPKDHPAHIQAARLVGPDDAPVNQPKKKEEPPITTSPKPVQPPQPGQPVPKAQTVQAKADTAPKVGGSLPNNQQAPEAPNPQKLSGDELKSSAEKNLEKEKEKPESPNQMNGDNKIKTFKGKSSGKEIKSIDFGDGAGVFGTEHRNTKMVDDIIDHIKSTIPQEKWKDIVFVGEGGRTGENGEMEFHDEMKYAAPKFKELGASIDSWDGDELDVHNDQSKLYKKQMEKTGLNHSQVKAGNWASMIGQGEGTDTMSPNDYLDDEGKEFLQNAAKEAGLPPIENFDNPTGEMPNAKNWKGSGDKGTLYRLSFPEDNDDKETKVNDVQVAFNETRDENLVQKTKDLKSNGKIPITIAGEGHVDLLGDKGETDKEVSNTAELKKLMPNAEFDRKPLSAVTPVERQQISTIIDKLAELGNQAKQSGDKAPNFNLCQVSVPGTNLYCDGNKGIPREDMPQFKGTPEPGSQADKLPKDKNGEADTEEFFKQMLEKQGIGVSEPHAVPADRLKATQSELVGVKVAGMEKALEDNPKNPAITAPIYVSNDGYVLDGHHRWAAIVAYNASHPKEQIPMNVRVIDEPIVPLVHRSNKFAETIGIKPKAADTAPAQKSEPVKKSSIIDKVKDWSNKEKQQFAKLLNKDTSKQERRTWKEAIMDKARGAGHAIMHGLKHEAHEFKTAGKALQHIATGNKLNDDEKKAIKSVGIKIATTALFGIATGGLSHGISGLAAHVAKELIPHAVTEVLASGALKAALFAEGVDDAAMLQKLAQAIAEKLETMDITPKMAQQIASTYKSQNKKEAINEAKYNDIKSQIIQDFVNYSTKRLKLKETPKVILINSPEYANAKASLGGYSPETKEIYAVSHGRLTADICRTIAHELVHRKQDEMGLLRNVENDGADGSPIENQAHAVAGILMREYGRKNKKIFQEDINVDVDKGDTVLMGKFKNKKVVVKDLGKDDHGMPTINGKVATTFRMGQKGQNIYEMGNKDIHFKNIIQLYRNAKFKKRINAFLFGNPNHNNSNDVARALRNMGYDDITRMEKELNIEPNYDEQLAKLYEDIEKYLTEISGLAGDDSQSDGAYLPKGRVRKLDGNDGVNKGDDWFYSGGYTQTDFPVADGLYGDEDENRMTVRYSARNLPRFGDKPTEFLKEGLLMEGGAYGHMAHPFDDMDLTFGDLKNIISSALNGDLGVVREKTDGQALAISWKNGRLIAARNKGNLANAGANAMGIDDVSSKFQGRGGLSDAYNYAMQDLNAAISGLSDAQRKKIFKEGQCFMNLEVIWPSSVNVIPYGQALLVFHNTVCYDEKGNAIGADGGAASTLAGMIKQINAHVQSKYTIQGPPIVSLPKNEDLSAKQGGYLSKLSKLQSQFHLKDDDNVADYHQSWWENFIDTKAPIKVDKLTKEALVRRWAFGDKSFRLNTISNPKLQAWAIQNDKVNVAKQQKDNIKPFEEIFLGVGADVLSFVGSVLTVHPDKAIRSMKDRLKNIASQVRSGGDPSKIAKLKTEMSRLNGLGGINNIVATEGLVFFYGGKTYKLTGTFAPLNQILGIFYS